MSGQQLLDGELIDWVIEQPVPSPRLPVALLSKAQKAAELQRVVASEAKLAAYKAELIMGLADDSPADDDPPPGSLGARARGWAPDGELPGVSEFFTAELSAVLNCGRGTASHQAVRAWTYRENLPATRAALAEGVLDEPRGRVLAEVLEHADRDVARAIEAELLPQARELSLGKLRKRALAMLVRRAPEAVDARREEARRGADVRTYPSPLEGMATLAVDLPPEEAAGCFGVVDELATLAKQAGDPRPIGSLRAAMLSALIQQPGDPARPAVTALLQVSAPLATLAGRSDEPGEVEGTPITATHLRALLEQLNALCPGGLQAPEGGELVLSLTGEDGALLATVTRAELERLARRGCPDHPAADCSCPVLAPPPASDGYAPTDAQRRFVKTRDRTCRFPNCARRVGWADLDHVIAHACGGATDCTNLCCLCRSHHRLKTHARGWRFTMTPDGVLTVTTPSGVTRTTRPPGLRRKTPEPRPPEPPPPRKSGAEPDGDPPF